MGRPRKSETGPVPTAERLFNKALELFAVKGFDGVSVREITRECNLNEATLYIHYKNKADLMDAILQRFEKNLLSPGFSIPPVEAFANSENFSLANVLIEGGRSFFSQADNSIILTWRMLMVSQYRYEPAGKSLEDQILDPPVKFFTGMLENMKTAGKLRPDSDCISAGRIIASVFFDFSFRSNLKAAWNNPDDEAFSQLTDDLKYIASTLEATD